MRFLRLPLLLFAALPLAAQNPPAKAEVVRYHATIDAVKYVYCVAPPVARLRPGNILEGNSLDCFGNAIKKPGDTLALPRAEIRRTGRFLFDAPDRETRPAVPFSILNWQAHEAFAPLPRGS